MNIVIDKEFQSLIQPLTKKEYEGLEQSILSEGCRDALVLWNDVLIDGHNRYEICMTHGIPFSTCHKEFASRDDAKLWMIGNQLARRNINNYARTTLECLSDEILQKQAEGKAKRSEQGGDRRSAFCEITKSEKPKVDTTKEVAKRANVGEQTASRVITINKNIDAAIANNSTVAGQKPEELKRQLMNGDITINKAYQDIKREAKAQRQEERREINTEKVERLASPLDAQGLFQTIVIDPPWDWGDEGDVNQLGRAKPEYHTMPIDEIERLPVAKIADDNCHLYLWVTNRSLPKAFQLIEAWGFRYITCLTWVKPYYGMGNYFRGSTEQVLFCVKGSQPLKRHDVGTHFEAPRGNGHSAKPDEFYKLVETCSYGPYIDVFGRSERPGWSVWGENG